MFKIQVSGFHVYVASPFLCFTFLWLRRFKVSMATPFLCFRRLKLFNFVDGCAVQGFSGYAVSMLRVSKKAECHTELVSVSDSAFFCFCFWLAAG